MQYIQRLTLPSECFCVMTINKWYVNESVPCGNQFRVRVTVFYLHRNNGVSEHIVFCMFHSNEHRDFELCFYQSSFEKYQIWLEYINSLFKCICTSWEGPNEVTMQRATFWCDSKFIEPIWFLVFMEYNQGKRARKAWKLNFIEISPKQKPIVILVALWYVDVTSD